MKEELKITTADERMAGSKNRTAKLGIFGEHGIGKTSLLKTLDAKSTLLVNTDFGDLAIKSIDKELDRIEPRTWQECKDIACYISGHNPMYQSKDDYSKEHYDYIKEKYSYIDLNKYRVIFFDSISRMSTLALNWSLTQPQAFTKNGELNLMGAYGLLGKQLVNFLYQLQFSDKNIVVVGALDKVTDPETKMTSWEVRVEGRKGANEILGVFDQIISMVWVYGKNNKKYRLFVCDKDNRWNYPAKKRSNLGEVESAHLGNLLNKILTDDGSKISFNYDMPEISEIY